MKKAISLLLATALAAPVACGFLFAQSPGQNQVMGHVLVLDNENVIEGDIQRREDDYIAVRNGGELTIPAERVLTVCADLDEAYKFLSTRMNLRDGDERLRLARWCHSHGLDEQAIAETKASLALRPGHPESTRFLTMLERAAAPVPEPPSADAPKKLTEMTVPVEVSADSLAIFSTKVQPILMNTCLCCHLAGKNDNFALVRPVDAMGRRATQVNLAAAVGQICFDKPGASPLLIKAQCAHGGAQQAPMGSNLAPALMTLQNWIHLTAAQNPQLRARGAQAGAIPPGMAKALAPSEAPVAVAAPVANVVPIAQSSSGEGEGAKPGPAARSVPAYTGVQNALSKASVPAAKEGEFRPVEIQEPAPVAVQAVDEFDPAIFNQMQKSKQ
jgi:hypothetical protein